MSAAHRLNGLNYTCSNNWFETDITKGYSHGQGQASGSVFSKELANNGYSLWLEHVKDKLHGTDTYWLMWYNASGIPTIPLSGVLDASDIKVIAGRLAEFLTIP